MEILYEHDYRSRPYRLDRHLPDGHSQSAFASHSSLYALPYFPIRSHEENQSMMMCGEFGISIYTVFIRSFYE